MRSYKPNNEINSSDNNLTERAVIENNSENVRKENDILSNNTLMNTESCQSMYSNNSNKLNNEHRKKLLKENLKSLKQSMLIIICKF